MTSRKQRFLAAMARCKTPFGADTNDSDYVEPPITEAARRIVARAEIDPGAVQFLVGGMGYGKTTQLRRACRELAKTGETVSEYVDIAEHHDLHKLSVGVVTAAVALALVKRLQQSDAPKQKASIEAIQGWANGRWIDPADEYDPGDPDHFDPAEDALYWEKGVLVPPDANVVATPIDLPLAFVAKSLANPVVCVDGLDRVQNQRALEQVLANDIASLRAAGVGLVVACAAWQRFGAARAAFDAESGLLSLAAWAPSIATHRAFLSACVRRRVDSELLPDDVLDALVVRSGGVLRDLFLLTAALIEESYLRGDTTLTEKALDGASERMGHRLLAGLSLERIKRLRDIARANGADVADSEVLELLAGGQLIYRADSGTMFVVHPTIVPLVARRASAA
jgi:hypothetical protein